MLNPVVDVTSRSSERNLGVLQNLKIGINPSFFFISFLSLEIQLIVITINVLDNVPLAEKDIFE